jgi:hypothetical protein
MVHLSIDHCTQPGPQVTPMRADHLDRHMACPARCNGPIASKTGLSRSAWRGLVVEREGKLLGTALWWPYGDDCATVGMVIVAPEARRQASAAC